VKGRSLTVICMVLVGRPLIALHIATASFIVARIRRML
jgi:hypothetical protein